MTAGTVIDRPQAAHEVTLVELVDRLLGKGVVAAGDVTLSVANVDLVYLDLRALLASAGSLATGEVIPATAPRPAPPAPKTEPSPEPEPAVSREAPAVRVKPRPRPALAPFPSRIEADPERLEKGLAQLVLTLVELLRDLMERQALRRIDDGTLADDQIDRLGETFMLLDQRMDELKEVFGLSDEELNLNLGPLGNLL
jgi:hypothetical protein